MEKRIPQEILDISAGYKEAGGRALLVGGCVRDMMIGKDPKDWDLEVYGISEEQIESVAQSFGKVNTVGKSFGVMKLNTESGIEYDIAMPRTESKTGEGHRGFDVVPDGRLSFAEAANRRDFTINAMGMDALTGEILDPFGGRDDLKKSILRPCSEKFKEDPLRVLRGMQFAGRFDLDAAPEFIRMAREVHGSFRELASERVYGEFSKWASKSETPGKGLEVLKQTGWISHFPEIHALVGCEQPKNWHPEGDVFTHTKHCCDALASKDDFKERTSEDRTTLMLTMLGHDFGKPETTRHVLQEDGSIKITAHGHEAAGVKPFLEFLSSMNAPKRDAAKGCPIIKDHLFHANFKEEPPKDKTVLRLAKRLSPASVSDLCLIMQSDLDGRPPLPQVPAPGVQNVLQAAVSLNVDQQGPVAFIGGKDLIAHGVEPGKNMGAKLDHYMERQLSGEFSTREEAIEMLDKDFRANAPHVSKTKKELAVSKAEMDIGDM